LTIETGSDFPIFFLPALFKPDEVENARESLLTWHRQEWEAHFGNAIPPSGHAGMSLPDGGRDGE
jgi:hypothetical protein